MSVADRLNPAATLLGLPRELREMIYDYEDIYAPLIISIPIGKLVRYRTCTYSFDKVCGQIRDELANRSKERRRLIKAFWSLPEYHPARATSVELHSKAPKESCIFYCKELVGRGEWRLQSEHHHFAIRLAPGNRKYKQAYLRTHTYDIVEGCGDWKLRWDVTLFGQARDTDKISQLAVFSKNPCTVSFRPVSFRPFSYDRIWDYVGIVEEVVEKLEQTSHGLLRGSVELQMARRRCGILNEIIKDLRRRAVL